MVNVRVNVLHSCRQYVDRTKENYRMKQMQNERKEKNRDINCHFTLSMQITRVYFDITRLVAIR